MIIGLSGCATTLKRHELTYYDYFDTIIEIVYYDNKTDTDEMNKKVEQILKYWHYYMSNYPGGVIEALNETRKANIPTLIPLFSKVLEWEEKTGYVIDISKGDLFMLWKNAIDRETLPNEKDIKAALEKGGPESIVLTNESVELKDGADVDLGAVCKGYLNEELKKFFKDEGIKNYIISAGGNVSVLGKPLEKKKDRFSIGIESPFEIGAPFDIIYANDKSLVTSGDYQRFAFINEKRYHHIVDLKTGYPAENGKRSITIVGDDAFLCDFLSTTLFLKSDEEIKEIIKDFPGYEYYIIYADGSNYVSEGLKPYVNSLGAKN
ncbi:MAG: FAD:protein FMN transferase [Ezakiella sp.]|nr:FAD:protein FMN transferase [Ezakiella sp.]MDY3923300.1 FAD:protein FMN transferase [Ezakiella sp.]